MTGIYDEASALYVESETEALNRQLRGQGRVMSTLGAAGSMGASALESLERGAAGLFATGAGFDAQADENIWSTGMEQFGERNARIARENQENARLFAGQAMASRMSEGQATAGRGSLYDKIGSDIVSVESKLAQAIESKVGFGIGEEELLSKEEIIAAVGQEAYDKMSPEEIGSLVRGAAQSTEKGREWLRDSQKSTGRELRQRAGGMKGSEERLQSMLEETGFLSGGGWGSVASLGGFRSAKERLSDEDRQLLALLDTDLAPELVIAAMRDDDPDQADALAKALIDKAAKEGGPDAGKAQMQKLRQAQRRVENISNDELKQRFKRKAQEIAGTKVMNALKEGKPGEAVKALQSQMTDLRTEVRAQSARDMATSAAGVFTEMGLDVGETQRYDELLTNLKAQGQDKLTDKLGATTAQKIMNLDAGSEEDLSKFIELTQGMGAREGERVSSKGVSEGVSGGESAKALEMTQEMMATFGNSMVQSNRIAVRSEGHLKRIADAVAGKDAIDVMSGNVEE
jgi:hypothetical protein